MKFNQLLPRYNSSPIDDDRIHGLVALNTIGANQPLVISGIQLSTSNALAVAIVDGSGGQITSFGGGTQYTDAATAAAHPIGTGIIFNNAGTYNFVSAAQPLPVTGSFSLTNPTIGAAVPTTANYIAGNKGGNLTGLLIGSQNTASSLAVALASDQVSIPVTTSGATIEKTGTAASLNADIVASFDVTAYKSASLQLTGSWSASIAIQGSNDNTNFVNVEAASIDSGNIPLTADTLGGNGLYKFPIQYRYIRIRATSYSSGTVVGTAEFYASSQDMLSNTAFGFDSNFIRGTGVFAANYIAVPGSNGFDMQREVINNTDSTGLGIAAVGILAQLDNTSPNTVTENQFGNVRMTALRGLHVSPKPDTLGGWSFNYQSALNATKAQIKGSAGNFGGYINLYNPNTAVTYIQVFNNVSGSVTVGTTAPDFVITLPGLATASGTGTDRNLEITLGVAMSTGITIAATTTATGNTSPANTITATFLYL